MLLFLKYWRIVVLLGFGLVCGVLGWRLQSRFSGSSIPPVSAEVRTQVVEKLVVRTVTVIKKPDGTVTEIVEEKEQSTQSTSSKPVKKSKYSVSAAASIDTAYPLKRPDYQFMGWRRLGEWDGWAGAGWDMRSKAVLVGIRWDL